MFYNSIAQRHGARPSSALPLLAGRLKNSVPEEIKPFWEAVHPESGSAPPSTALPASLSPPSPRHGPGLSSPCPAGSGSRGVRPCPPVLQQPALPPLRRPERLPTATERGLGRGFLVPQGVLPKPLGTKCALHLGTALARPWARRRRGLGSAMPRRPWFRRRKCGCAASGARCPAASTSFRKLTGTFTRVSGTRCRENQRSAGAKGGVKKRFKDSGLILK